MEETKTEETNENPVEEETTEKEPEKETPEKPQEEEKETPKEKTDSPEQYTEREKRYYARMKQAENIAKTAREELAKSKGPVSEVDAILEVQEATKDLDAQEVVELRLRADALHTSLTDARKSEGFALWQQGYKEKVEKENPPLPSTTQGNVKGEKQLKDMTLEERTVLFEKAGLVTKQTYPRPPRK